jgi:hypothetical protein
MEDRDCEVDTLQAMCVQQLDSLEELLAGEPAMMYIIFCDQFNRMLTIERQAIALTILANDLTASNEDLILAYVNAENLNIMIGSGMYKGETLAFNLITSEAGRKLLLRGNLAEVISSGCLNSCMGGRYSGESLALRLLLSTDSDTLLLLEKSQLVRKISRESLNHIIDTGLFQHLSLAILLAATAMGRLLLCAEANRLMPFFTPHTINSVIIAEGEWCGLSVAFLLLSSPYAAESFAHFLRPSISSECFNRIIETPQYAGQSVAHVFVSSQRIQPHFEIATATLNRIVIAGPIDAVGTSVAFHLLMTSTHPYSNYFDDLNNLRKLTAECLNYVVPAGVYKGISVAWNLIGRVINSTLEVREVLKNEIFPLLAPDTLNSQICHEGQRSSVAALLAATEIGCEILAHDNCRLARAITPGTLRSACGPQNLPCAYFLASVGLPTCNFFELDDHRLLRALVPKTVNRLTSGPLAGYSLLMCLARSLVYDENGPHLLSQHNYYLSDMISADTLNHVVYCLEAPTVSHLSLALLLSLSYRGLDILTRNDFHLADQISPESLNYIVPAENEEYEGLSLALVLSASTRGREILCRQSCRLAMKITSDTLNHVVSRRINLKHLGGMKGKSVAFCLASSLWPSVLEGEREVHLLRANNYYLGDMISASTLNQLCPSGSRKNTSVALWLSVLNRDILKHNDHRLIDLVDAEALNAIVPSGDLAAVCMAQLLLAFTPDVMRRHDFRLAMMITADTLNRTVNNKLLEQGRAVALHLAMDCVGAFCAHGYHLASMITAETINDRSVFSLLCMEAEGREALCSEDMRLAKLLNADTLFTKMPALEDKECEGLSLSPWNLLVLDNSRRVIKCSFNEQLVKFFKGKFNREMLIAQVADEMAMTRSGTDNQAIPDASNGCDCGGVGAGDSHSADNRDGSPPSGSAKKRLRIG